GGCGVFGDDVDGIRDCIEPHRLCIVGAVRISEGKDLDLSEVGSDRICRPIETDGRLRHAENSNLRASAGKALAAADIPDPDKAATDSDVFEVIDKRGEIVRGQRRAIGAEGIDARARSIVVGPKDAGITGAGGDARRFADVVIENGSPIYARFK